MPADMPEKKSAFDLSRGAIPIAAALGLLLLVASGAMAAGAWLNDVRRDRSELVGQIAAVQIEVADIKRQLVQLNERANNAQPEAWFLRFCFEAERANPNWRCPPIILRPMGGDVAPLTTVR